MEDNRHHHQRAQLQDLRENEHRPEEVGFKIYIAQTKRETNFKVE
jgi:hypothetical protein